MDAVQNGDRVYGTLPVELAAEKKRQSDAAKRYYAKHHNNGTPYLPKKEPKVPKLPKESKPKAAARLKASSVKPVVVVAVEVVASESPEQASIRRREIAEKIMQIHRWKKTQKELLVKAR